MKEEQHADRSKRVQSSVNPQGLSEDKKDHRPKTQLEDRAKKKNTKI